MKRIPLTQGKFAIVDDEDYAWLSQWKWHLSSNGYANRTINFTKKNGRRSTMRVWMHRVINKTPNNMFTDHIDNNKINNRRKNLRSCNAQQNRRNSPSEKMSGSKYKGVCWHKRDMSWIAGIAVDYKIKWLGYFPSEKAAAMAYNNAAKKYFGEFAKLNKIRRKT